MSVHVLITDPKLLEAPWGGDYYRTAYPGIMGRMTQLENFGSINFMAQSPATFTLLRRLGLPVLKISAVNGTKETLKNAIQNVGSKEDTYVIMSGAAPNVESSSIDTAVRKMEANPQNVVRSCAFPKEHPCQYRKYYSINHVGPVNKYNINGTSVSANIGDSRTTGKVVLLAIDGNGYQQAESALVGGKVTAQFQKELSPKARLHCIVKSECTEGQCDQVSFFEPTCGLWQRDKDRNLTLDQNGNKIWGRQAFPEVYEVTEHFSVGNGASLMEGSATPCKGLPITERESLIVANEIDAIAFRTSRVSQTLTPVRLSQCEQKESSPLYRSQGVSNS